MWLPGIKHCGMRCIVRQIWGLGMESGKARAAWTHLLGSSSCRNTQCMGKVWNCYKQKWCLFHLHNSGLKSTRGLKFNQCAVCPAPLLLCQECTFLDEPCCARAELFIPRAPQCKIHFVQSYSLARGCFLLRTDPGAAQHSPTREQPLLRGHSHQARLTPGRCLRGSLGGFPAPLWCSLPSSAASLKLSK